MGFVRRGESSGTGPEGFMFAAGARGEASGVGGAPGAAVIVGLVLVGDVMRVSLSASWAIGAGRDNGAVGSSC